MLRFLLHKLMHKKGLVLSLLIGNILLVAIASSHAIYKNAALHRMLTDEFIKVVEEQNIHPVMFTVSCELDRATSSQRLWSAKALAEGLCNDLGVKEEIIIANYMIPTTKVKSNFSNKEKTIQLSALVDFDNHIEIVNGRAYNKGLNENGHYEAVISEAALINSNLLVGETLEFTTVEDADGNTLKIDIVGVFKNSESIDPYWAKAPSEYKDVCFMDYDCFYQRFLEPIEDGSRADAFLKATWYVQVDVESITPGMSDSIIDKTNKLIAAYPKGSSTAINLESTDHNTTLEEFKLTQSRISSSLLVLEIPVLALLCAFIFMIAAQLLELEENEISQLKSRGAGRFQIFGLYLMQSTLLAILAILAGIPLGSFLCQALGSANAFLEFVERTPLTVEITTEVMLYAIGAAAVSIIITVFPAFKHSKLTILDTKQKRTHRKSPIWQRLFLDVLLIGVSLYGYYSFNSKRDNLFLSMLEGEPLDPLLFFSSALFILGLGLFCLRIQPIIVKFIFTIGKRLWRPANFSSLLQIIRTGSKQYFIMAFMIFTVSLGIFFATVARTILSNAENNTAYSLGADLILKEKWQRKSPDSLIYIEPDFSRYNDIPEIEAIAKVMRVEDCNIRLSTNELMSVDMMSIDTKDFGEVINMQDGLLPTHINNYLNRLAATPNGILVSKNFKDDYGYALGDRLVITDFRTTKALNFIIVGFFDYWPGYQATDIVINPDETTNVVDNYLIVSNFTTVLSSWEISPYEVWIKLAEGADTAFVGRFVDKYNVTFTKFSDLTTAYVDIHNNTLFQGTNGILTMSFIIILVLYAIGFLIYWILSIKSRELLFGVLRAMGMSRSEILHMLINEQIFTGLLSVGFGCIIGYLVTVLFVPLIQIAYSTGIQALPLELITNANDLIKLFAIIGITLVFCMAILTRIVFKLKISEALKLGED